MNDKNPRKLIDARHRFKDINSYYQVSIEVECNLGLLLAVLKGMFKQKKLRINHTFTNDPLLNKLREPDL